MNNTTQIIEACPSRYQTSPTSSLFVHSYYTVNKTTDTNTKSDQKINIINPKRHINRTEDKYLVGID